jgi:hypothetical protein
VSASVLYMSMSLDGYIAGPDDGPNNPGGDGFDRLHEWFGDFSRPSGPRGVPKVACHAAYSYSWISPPRRSHRRNPPRIGPPLGSPGTDGTGAM